MGLLDAVMVVDELGHRGRARRAHRLLVPMSEAVELELVAGAPVLRAHASLARVEPERRTAPAQPLSYWRRLNNYQRQNGGTHVTERQHRQLMRMEARRTFKRR